MKYNEVGNSGIRVSEIGIGCEGFLGKSEEEVKAMIDACEEAGINCIDMYTPEPEFHKALGKALKGRRDRFVLQAHLSSIWKNGQYLRTRDIREVKQAFEDRLTLLGTDHIDLGLIHYIDAMDDWKEVSEGQVMKYALELKAQGKIRLLGISSHNPEVGLAAAESGLIDTMLFSINPCYDLLPAGEDVNVFFDPQTFAGSFVNMDPQRQRLYEVCQSRGIGLTVMKAFGGGDLLSAELSPAGLALTPVQCIHYALTRPGVVSVMAGAHSLAELDQAAAYETASEEERDYAAAFASMKKISWEGHCMYCGHCAPCPVKISVADVTKFLNLTLAQGMVPETVREHYEVLPHHAGECIACGVCETRCPFHVSVRENMKKAAEVFGK